MQHPGSTYAGIVALTRDELVDQAIRATRQRDELQAKARDAETTLREKEKALKDKTTQFEHSEMLGLRWRC